MKPFPAAILGIFLALALFGVFIFATFTASRQDAIGTVLIWGSVPQEVMDNLFTAVRGERDDFNSVKYDEIPADQLVPELVQAIAAGRGPDLVVFPASSYVKDGEKLLSIPYNTLSRRDFQDSYVEAGEVFLAEDGVKGLPFTIDPLVLYWNRTLFSNAGVARPPKYWDDLAQVAPQLTQKAPNGSLTVSAVALGSWDNVAHAKGILVTLITELGMPVVTQDVDGRYESTLAQTTDTGVSPADSALRYYTDFADPVKPVYSWNRSQKSSRDAFLAGTLALYVGFASELLPLREANPNLNFDIAPLPVTRGGGEGVYAEVQALSVPRGAKNVAGATTVALVLSAANMSALVSEATHLPSPRRDVELAPASDAYLSVFRSAALKSFTFLDPDPTASNQIFGRMIDAVSSGRLRLSEAVRAADEELGVLLDMQ